MGKRSFWLTIFFLILFIRVFVAFPSQQTSYLLDLDNPLFNFTETTLVNGSTPYEIEFTGIEDKIVAIKIPRSSRVLLSNISFQGVMRPVQASAIEEIFGIEVGDVKVSSENEIAVAASNYIILLDNLGNEIWNYSVSGVYLYDVSIGNLSNDPGNEVVGGASNYNIYILNSSGNLVDQFSIGGAVRAVDVGDVNPSLPYDEIAVGGEDNRIYLFDSQGNKLWNYTTSGAVKGVSIGNLSNDPGNEVVGGGSDYKIYLLNSSGDLKWSISLGIGINSIDVGDVNPSLPYDEIAVATDNGSVYLLDSQGTILWSFVTTSGITNNIIRIGEVTTDPGREIVVGSNDNKVYVLSSSGELIWSFEAEDWVRGLDVGELTTDPGNEVVAGTRKVTALNNLYILNFEYYPTNVTLDIGNDGAIEWKYEGKFRTSGWVTNDSAFQAYLDSCSQEYCEVPLVFHSDFAGILRIDSIEVDYEYNLSDIVNYTIVSEWSRTYDVWVNESIGNRVKNISYLKNPVIDVSVDYVRVDELATVCDFDGRRFDVIVVNGTKVCDISSLNYVISSSGQLSSSKLWDDTMPSGIPVIINESTPIIEGGFWKKNITIWNNTPTIFYNITANTTIGEEAIADSRLRVFWNGKWYDLINSTFPSSVQTDCNTSTPTFTPLNINSDVFYVCKQDLDGDGVVDYFVWKQPHTSSTLYEASASANHLANIEDVTIKPPEDYWGSQFNVSANVTDPDGDNVTVRLWAYINLLDTWELIGEKNVSSNEIVNFTILTNKSWTGINKIKFEYNDFNVSEGYYHDWRFTQEYLGPNVTKHPVSIGLISGNDTDVNRTESTLLVIQINDSLSNQPISDTTCRFWVTLNDTTWSWENLATSNASGICEFNFSPNASFEPGLRKWRAGVIDDTYYEDTISENYTIRIYGRLNINFTQSSFYSNFTRDTTSSLKAVIFDEFGKIVEDTPGATCSLWINETPPLQLSTSPTNGYCSFSWTTNCNYTLGAYLFNLTLSGDVPYYFLDKTESKMIRYLKDDLIVLIHSPNEDEAFYYGDTIFLNSSVFEKCGNPPNYSYSVRWNGSYLVDKIYFDPLYETWEVQGQNTSYTINYGPGKLKIQAEAKGDYYNPGLNSTNVWVYGFSEVDIISPQNGTFNRSEYEQEISIVCFVFFPNATATDKSIEGYSVWIWSKYEETGEVKLLASGTTNSSGYFTYSWNVSDNTTVPEGGYLIKCNISDQWTGSYSFFTALKDEDLSEVIILDYDINPPTINSVEADSITPGNDVTIRVNITDWYGVDKVWIKLIYPNASSQIIYLTNTTPDKRRTIWEVTLFNLGDIGDYDFTVYANDTSNNLATTQWWFGVYDSIQMYLNSSSSLKFLFLRPNKTYMIHTFEANPFEQNNWTLFKRLYDLDVLVSDSRNTHRIRFKGLNTTATSEYQFGFVSNITNPINASPVSLLQLDPPVPSRHELAALLVDSIFIAQQKFIIINYSYYTSESLPSDERIDFESNRSIVVFKCSSWVDGVCSSGWVKAEGSWIDMTYHLLYVPVQNFSLFYALEIEICGNNICGEGESPLNCPEDCGPPAGGGEGAGAGVGVGPVCGNGICEPGENETTCPIDCAFLKKFTARTNATEVEIEPGTSKTYAIWIRNLANETLSVSIDFEGSAAQFVRYTQPTISLQPFEEKEVRFIVSVPYDATVGTYLGGIVLRGDSQYERIPFKVVVSLKEAVEIDVIVESLTRRVRPNGTARFHITIYNLGAKRRFNLTLNYSLENIATGEVIYSEIERIYMETSKSFVKTIKIPGDVTPGIYSFVVQAIYKKKKAVSSDTLQIVKPLLTQTHIKLIIIFASLLVSLAVWRYAKKRYEEWKFKKAKYIFPVDFRKLPKGELQLGRIAESRVKATFSMNDLTTHVLIAGATGAGKSVGASIFVEELLERKIPVVVFDPTAQWTGFVRPCRDRKVLRYYKKFGLDPRRHPKSYKGMIFEVTDPNIKIDFKKYMNPGEITIFTLNKLKPGEYDEAVKNIVDTIFSQPWEESTELKLVIVFDEVHRLLEKYGGKGGYVALERACREFRKWGIGLIMASQVLSDFKEAIRGNVLTEILMHTKSIEDLTRAEKKYGLEYAKRIAREEVGVGMIQNPKYNDGIPWFISFRPPYHNPHKIPEKEMEMYKEFARVLEMIEDEISKLEKEGKDVFSLKVELKLAKDKLKQGRFRMAEIYINSLKKSLGLEHGR